METFVPLSYGLRVVALTEGRLAGFVYRVFLNLRTGCISGFSVQDPRLGNRESWVAVADVRQLGENVLLVDRSSALKPKPPVGRNVKDLMGLPVTTLDGRVQGSLLDVRIDGAWRVVEIALADGRVVLLPSQGAVFGRDAVLLPTGTAPEAPPRIPQGDRGAGLLARIFGPEHITEIGTAILRTEKAATSPGRRRRTPPPARG